MGQSYSTISQSDEDDVPSSSSSERLSLSSRWSHLDFSSALTWFNPSDHEEPFDKVAMSAVSRLPLPMQIAFRLKLLTIFTLQLGVVAATVGVFALDASAKALATRLFANPMAWFVGGDVAVLISLFVLLTFRDRFPLNWLLLLLFTLAQLVALVALCVLMESPLVAYNMIFSWICVVVLLALASVRHRTEEKLLSTAGASLVAYVAAFALSLCLFFSDHLLLTGEELFYSLLFQAALLFWFALDVRGMYRAMSPDEYMLGIVFFYSDLIVLTIIAALIALTIVIADDCGNNNSASSANCDPIVCVNCPSSRSLDHSVAYVDCDCCCCCCTDKPIARQEQRVEVRNRNEEEEEDTDEEKRPILQDAMDRV